MDARDSQSADGDEADAAPEEQDGVMRNLHYLLLAAAIFLSLTMVRTAWKLRTLNAAAGHVLPRPATDMVEWRSLSFATTGAEKAQTEAKTRLLRYLEKPSLSVYPVAGLGILVGLMALWKQRRWPLRLVAALAVAGCVWALATVLQFGVYSVVRANL